LKPELPEKIFLIIGTIEINLKIYSNKLNRLFKENLIIVIKPPESGNPTKNDDMKFIIVSHFEIFFKITSSEIVVLDIWDTRQNPDNFPIK
jgi:toxin YoeB